MDQLHKLQSVSWVVSLLAHGLCAVFLVFTFSAQAQPIRPFFVFLGPILDRRDLVEFNQRETSAIFLGDLVPGNQVSAWVPSGRGVTKPGVTRGAGRGKSKTYIKETFLRETSSPESVAGPKSPVEPAPYVPLRMR